jgi:Tol biopolymer transport system component
MVGETLQQYRVLERIGAGGMGEVYRAADTRLGRDVAIKILPPAMAQDADRLARFEREARALAALNHPHIAALHGLEESDGLRFLVMEFVPGVSLTGPLPLDEALPLLLQVADALEASHEKGIIHRDLKPANIRVTPDGKAKVLDFGLAKAADVSPSYDSSHSPTVGADATREGSMLGTAAYMSPEQLRGRPTDRRADIWAFGCLLYEVLTGRKAFHGETPSDTTVAILRNEPDWNALPKETPESIRALLRRCVQKDPMRRIRDMGDVRLHIEEAIAELHQPPAAPAAALSIPAPAPRSTGMLIGIAVALVLAAALGAWWLRGRLEPAEPARTVAVHRLTDFEGLERYPALSPDGRSVAFTADLGGSQQIWVRLLSGGPPLQITKGPVNHINPRWSRDSSTILYFEPSAQPGAQGVLWEVPALGGSPRRITDAISGGDFSPDGQSITFFRAGNGVIELAVAARDGSGARAIAPLSPDRNYHTPRWSPDGRTVAFVGGRIFNYDIYAVPVGGGASPRAITAEGTQIAGFAWRDNQELIYSTSRGSTILYNPLTHLWSARVTGGEPRQLTFGEVSYPLPDVVGGRIVAQRVGRQFDIWRFPIDGSTAENIRRGVRITRQTGLIQTPSVSPDGNQLVYLSDSGGHGNLWILSLDSGQPRQLTFEQAADVGVGVPVWSPDGRHIAFVMRKPGQWNVDQWIISPDGSNRRKVADLSGWAAWSHDTQWLYYAPPGDAVYRIEKIPVAGGTPVVVRTDNAFSPAPAPDGKTLYYAVSLSSVTGVYDLEIRVAQPEDGPSKVLARISGSRIPAWQLIQPVLSPDGKWLALPLTDATTTNIWAVSTADGSLRQITDLGPRPTWITRRVSWSPDGRYIYAAVGEGDVT